MIVQSYHTIIRSLYGRDAFENFFGFFGILCFFLARKSEDLGVMLPMQNLLKSPENNDVTDQIMEQLVKTATQTPRDHSTVISRRRRSRNSQRKSRE